MCFWTGRSYPTIVTSREAVIGRPVNAAIAWTMIGAILLAAALSLLADAHLWGGFSVLFAVVAALPAGATRDWTTMVHWPLLAVAAVAVLTRAVGLFPAYVGYLALASLATVIVVELVEFTSVELSRRFAIGFAVLTTLALEALWIVAQFASDVLLGTAFLTTQVALQRDILIVTAVGFAVGGLFLGLFEVVEPMAAVDRSGDDVHSR